MSNEKPNSISPSSLARMAGNIASGLVNQYPRLDLSERAAQIEIARVSVAIAHNIADELGAMK